MQDFLFDRMKAQEAVPEPYMLYNKEQATEKKVVKNDTLRDMEYFRSMYPARVKSLQLIVEEVFDEVDYKESPMYDEYPDRMVIESIFKKIQKKADSKTVPEEPAVIVAAEEVGMPHMPYGPEYAETYEPRQEGYKTWEMEEGRLEAEQLNTERLWQQELSGRHGPGGPPPGPPSWSPPPGPPSWGPPPGPPPWGPPPPSRPWGPPPPPRPWGPPPPPPGSRDLDDLLRLLLFGEMQRRRCHGRNCR